MLRCFDLEITCIARDIDLYAGTAQLAASIWIENKPPSARVPCINSSSGDVVWIFSPVS